MKTGDRNIRKRDVLFVAGVMAFSVLFTGCGKSKTDDGTTTAQAETSSGSGVQQEVLSFVGEKLPAISADRDKAIDIYNKAVADKLKSEEMMMNLKDSAMPALQSYINALDAIEVKIQLIDGLLTLFGLHGQTAHDGFADAGIKIDIIAVDGSDQIILLTLDSRLRDVSGHEIIDSRAEAIDICPGPLFGYT